MTVMDNLRFHAVNFSDKFRGQQVFGRALTDDFSVFDTVDPVAEHSGNIKIMDGGDHSKLQIFDNFHKMELVGDVQMIGGLIKDQAGFIAAALDKRLDIQYEIVLYWL